MANNNLYVKTDWTNYDKSITILENLNNNSIITQNLLNHMEEGIYSANKPLKIGKVTASDVMYAEIVENENERLLNLMLVQGPKGNKGDQGATGPQGPVGLIGAQGIRGSNGKDGKSAYQIASVYGYEGTEPEWIESLKGKTAYQYAVDGGYKGTESEFIQRMASESAEEILKLYNPDSLVMRKILVNGITNENGEIKYNIIGLSYASVASCNRESTNAHIQTIGVKDITIKFNDILGDPLKLTEINTSLVLFISY